MKHWFKKSAAIAMSAVMALSLAACASSKPATPEEVLQAASEKVSAAKSMTCETTTQMKMSAGGQSIQMTMTGELETTMDPVAMHMRNFISPLMRWGLAEPGRHFGGEPQQR